MELLHLPLDLIHLIIQETIPESFENFVLTSTTLYQTSEPYRENYNELRQELRHVKFTDENELSLSLQLIQLIAEHPIFGRYIVHADLRGSEDNEPISRRQCETILEASSVHRLLNDSQYLSAVLQEEHTKWALDQLVTKQTPNFRPNLFLLTLLPNLVDLTLPSSWGTFEPEKQPTAARLIDFLIASANNPDKPSAGLSRLMTIRPSVAMGYEERFGLQVYVPFLSINSVRNFYTSSCIAINDGYTGIDFNIEHFPTFGQGLELVQMAACVVGPKEVTKFLSCTPRLRSFSYSHETKWHGCGYDWDAGAFLAAIEETTSETLEELSVSIKQCYGSTGTGVYSIQKFKRLRKLEFDLRLFKGLDHMRNPLDDEPKFLQLIDFLPSSIESVVLLSDLQENHIDALDELFVNLEERVGTALPLLQNLVVKYSLNGSTFGGSDTPGRDPDDPRWKRISTTLEAVGGKLIQVEGEAVAEFMETFCDRFDIGDS